MEAIKTHADASCLFGEKMTTTTDNSAEFEACGCYHTVYFIIVINLLKMVLNLRFAVVTTRALSSS